MWYFLVRLKICISYIIFHGWSTVTYHKGAIRNSNCRTLPIEIAQQVQFRVTWRWRSKHTASQKMKMTRDELFVWIFSHLQTDTSHITEATCRETVSSHVNFLKLQTCFISWDHTALFVKNCHLRRNKTLDYDFPWRQCFGWPHNRAAGCVIYPHGDLSNGTRTRQFLQNGVAVHTFA